MGMEPPELMTVVRAREPEGSPEWQRADEWLKEWEAHDIPQEIPAQPVSRKAPNPLRSERAEAMRRQQ